MTPDWLIGRPVDWLDWIDAGYTRRLVPILTVVLPSSCSDVWSQRARMRVSFNSIESSASSSRPACAPVAPHDLFLLGLRFSFGSAPFFTLEGILIVPLNI